MTTGAPGTSAKVVNSGTPENAVLDFVIPQGEPGSVSSPEFLTAYSLAPQAGVSGKPVVFDRTSASNGTSITHTKNSADIVVNRSGYYAASFHGTLSPVSGAQFPVNAVLYLQLNGNAVTGTGARQTLLSASDAENVAFLETVKVTTVPAILSVACEGDTILYSDAAVTVVRLGGI